MMGLQKSNLVMLTCASVNLTMKAFVRKKCVFFGGNVALLFAILILMYT